MSLLSSDIKYAYSHLIMEFIPIDPEEDGFESFFDAATEFPFKFKEVNNY